MSESSTFRVFTALFEAVRRGQVPPHRLAWFVVHGSGDPARFKRLIAIAAAALRGEEAVRIDFAIAEAALEAAPVAASLVSYACKA